ncbi:MAG: CapA family protein [Muribaculaceae bacterium]|nr:CapA family protein [Muribaculaceae bacterium]
MKIALLGDIALIGRFSQRSILAKGYFSELIKLLAEVDIIIGNLESPFVTDQQPYGAKSAHIGTQLDNIEILKSLGVNFLNLANNHIFDFGRSSYELTKSLLDESGIGFFGTEEKNIIVEKSGEKLQLFGFCCYSTNPLCIGKHGVNKLNINSVKSALKQATQNKYLPILSIHTGEEHVNYPNVDYIKWARALSCNYNYILYGHHPHVVQGWESVNRSLLLYSLGNFCFDDIYTSKSSKPLVKLSDNNKRGAIAIIEINKGAIVNYRILPIYMGQEQMTISKNDDNPFKNFSDSLNFSDELEYSSMRSNLIHEYISSRKSLRDFEWYIKRFNITSVKMILNAKRNAYLYKKNVKNILSSWA